MKTIKQKIAEKVIDAYKQYLDQLITKAEYLDQLERIKKYYDEYKERTVI